MGFLTNIGTWIYHFQSLIGGLLALVAAGISVIFIRQQIAQTETLHQFDLQRRHNAVKAVMPLALSLVKNWLQTIENTRLQYLDDEYITYRLHTAQEHHNITYGDGVVVHSFFTIAAVPQDAITIFREFVETLSCDEIIGNISRMIFLMQGLGSAIPDLQYTEVEDYYAGLETIGCKIAEIRVPFNELVAYCATTTNQAQTLNR
jgi:hypothetical protein